MNPMIRFQTLIPAILLFCSVSLLVGVSAVEAAVLSLNPASSSTPLNNTFQVQVAIDTEGESVTSTDAVILYNSSLLQVQSIIAGSNGSDGFFPDLFQNVAPNEIYVGASIIDPTDVKSGSGVVATITFQGTQTGITDVTFDCTAGKTADTNISKSDKNATDIVDCTRLTTGKYTIGSGAAQPLPTLAPSQPPPPPTATMIPTGSGEATVGIVGLGLFLLFAGAGSKLLFKM